MHKSLLFAKDYLNRNRQTLVIVREEGIVFSSEESGIKGFLKAMRQESLQGCYVADKIVGKALALLMVKVKIKGVYTPLISEKALEILHAEGVEIYFDDTAEYIKNRAGDGSCPMEMLCANISAPEEAYRAICEKLGLKMEVSL